MRELILVLLLSACGGPTSHKESDVDMLSESDGGLSGSDASADMTPALIVNPDLTPAPCGAADQACCPIVDGDQLTACVGYNSCINSICQPCGAEHDVCCTNNRCQGGGRCMGSIGDGLGVATAFRCTLETDCGTNAVHCCEGALCLGNQTCDPVNNGASSVCR